MQADKLAKYAVLNDFEATTSGLRAFKYMLSAAMERGDPLGDIAGGVDWLMEQQCRALEVIESEVRAEYQRHDEMSGQPISRPQADPKTMRAGIIADKINEGFNAGEIAQALNLKTSTVERVIGQLIGQPVRSDDHDEAATG
ncbi:hypothetical protein [Rhizobium leguminosarum]|nr:hypothetical protein [Rhizobium leguminosarum]TAX26334.1 hypothetical protein ELI06_24590 [Rhizobium leguminosarum]